MIAEARRRYAAQATDPAAMPPALRQDDPQRGGAACGRGDVGAAARSGQVEKTPLVKDICIRCWRSTEDKALARRALDLALTDEPGATNSPDMIGTVAGQHPDLAFDFAMAHRAQVETKVDGSRSLYFPRSATLAGAGDGRQDRGVRQCALAAAPAARRRRRSPNRYRSKVRSERLPAVDAWLEKNGG